MRSPMSMHRKQEQRLHQNRLLLQQSKRPLQRAIQKKTAVKSVKQASEPAVINGDFSKYLTEFAFTDHLGNAFTESHPVTKDSNVIIRYEFKIPNVFHLDGLSGVAQKLNN